MENTIAELLAQYGYFAVFFGCLIEGESVLLLAGFAAYQGYLSFPAVVGIAFCGGALSDHALFFIGRRFGSVLFPRFPRFAVHAELARQLVHRYHVSLCLGMRFLYGLRTVGPLTLGMSDVKAWRFTCLNLTGAAVWAALFTGVGFALGPALESLLVDFWRGDGRIILWIVAAVLLLGLIRCRRSDRR